LLGGKCLNNLSPGSWWWRTGTGRKTVRDHGPQITRLWCTNNHLSYIYFGCQFRKLQGDVVVWLLSWSYV